MSGAIPPRRRARRGSSRRRLAALGLAAVGVLIVVVPLTAVGVARQEHGPVLPPQEEAASPTAPRSPSSTPPPPNGQGTRPLRGVPLQDPTGLRLLLADLPPFVLDVDRGAAERITGLPTARNAGVSVEPVGEHALVLWFPFCDGCRAAARVYLLRRGSSVATRLAATEVTPSRDGEGVWLLGRSRAGSCTVEELGLVDGKRRATRRVPCRTDLVAELTAGLFVSYAGAARVDTGSTLLKPDGSAIRLRHSEAQPVVGNLVLTGGDRRTPLLLHDVSSGARVRLRWPSKPGYALGEVTGQPSGRFAVVEFAKYSPEHRLDLWLLDTETRGWQHLPGVPTRLVAKATDVEWTADGRVVVLTGDVLGVWRPGDPRLSVRRVKPATQPESSFVVW